MPLHCDSGGDSMGTNGPGCVSVNTIYKTRSSGSGPQPEFAGTWFSYERLHILICIHFNDTTLKTLFGEVCGILEKAKIYFYSPELQFSLYFLFSKSLGTLTVFCTHL